MENSNHYWSTPGFRALVWAVIKFILTVLKIFWPPTDKED